MEGGREEGREGGREREGEGEGRVDGRKEWRRKGGRKEGVIGTCTGLIPCSIPLSLLPHPGFHTPLPPCPSPFLFSYQHPYSTAVRVVIKGGMKPRNATPTAGIFSPRQTGNGIAKPSIFIRKSKNWYCVCVCVCVCVGVRLWEINMKRRKKVENQRMEERVGDIHFQWWPLIGFAVLCHSSRMCSDI